MKTTGRVNGIISNIVIVKADGPVGQNEICHVYCGDTKMMAEVIKVVGDNAYVQVFDSTRGLKIGEKVEFEGHMLEATLAPGLLSRNYDGLQNDLEKMDGLFIARGSITDPIDFEKKWEFNAVAKVGDQVIGGDILGTVQETAVVLHKIMVPPTMRGTITSIRSGSFNVTETIATLKTEDGREVPLTMLQKWPVRVGRPYTKKYPPKRPLCSGQRIIDTMFPIAKGGTAAVPGPFGSGKTVVAVAAMLQAVGAGYQAVLVAPTQVLAEQHYETISKMVSGLTLAQPGAKETDAAADVEGAMGASGASTVSSSKVTAEIPVTLLTGGMKLAARRKALAAAASGEPGIIVATHAAFSKTFQAPHLALVVIDEQHRFGVEQRESLNAKTDDGTTPHLLVMTATPIPRTAAMTWFGDLDISWLTELPGGRKPIRTVVVNEADAATMGRMFAHIRARVDAGERAYIVCPRIDADDEENEGGSGVSAAAGSARGRAAASGSSARTAAGGRATRAAADAIGIDDPYETFDENGETVARPPLHAVAEIADRLQKLPQFQGIRFATLTGRDKDDVKTQVMADFAGGETPILVSTTVIEVGVDVKQASCIVIFDADRYGLSQLHQLRGRVGRGGTNSWAFLISRAEPGSK